MKSYCGATVENIARINEVSRCSGVGMRKGRRRIRPFRVYRERLALIARGCSVTAPADIVLGTLNETSTICTMA